MSLSMWHLLNKDAPPCEDYEDEGLSSNPFVQFWAWSNIFIQRSDLSVITEFTLGRDVNPKIHSRFCFEPEVET